MLIGGVLTSLSTLVVSQSRQTQVVGLLITHPPADDFVVELLRRGLRKYGWEDGKNVRIEVRTAQGQIERVPGLARELVAIPCDVLVVVNEVALREVARLTRTIPIVMVGYNDDPVARGWIKSYGHPGGNITGVFSMNAALGAKRLEILKEMFPGASVAVIWDAFGNRQLEELRSAAPVLGVRVEPIQITGAADLDVAFKTAKTRNAGAVLMVFSPIFWVHRVRIAKLAHEMKLPTMSEIQIATEAGGLLSYGSDNYYNWERAGYFADRLLKGAHAADLPVEQLSNLVLAVNLRTAKALGVKIPETIMSRADEIIR